MKKTFHACILLIGFLVCQGWAYAQPLTLIDTISIQQFQVEPIKWTYATEGELLEGPDFGFLNGGTWVVLGRGGWTYDITTRELKKRFPDTSYWPLPSADGCQMLVSLQGEAASPWSGHLAWLTSNGVSTVKPKWVKAAYPKHAALHPNGRILAVFDPAKRNLSYYGGIVFIDLQTGQAWKADWIDQGWGSQLVEMFGFVENGRFLKVQTEHTGETRLLDTQTFRLLPAQEEDGYVFNRDASWVAGFSSNFDSDDKQIALFIWDRNAKRFVWKGEAYGSPVSFSQNDAYLLTRAGYILASRTGEIAFRNLQGKYGKFGPDGRSLVTVDDQAFYIYTLSKDSEPIFGVFQKPAPWSPPPAKKSMKTIKKP